MTPYYESDTALIYHASYEEVLYGVELPAISTVISDPPWWGMAHAQRVALGLQEFDDEQEAIWLAKLFGWYAKWIPRMRQMVEYASGRAWFFTGPTHMAAMARMAHLAGWPTRRLFLAPECYALLQFGRPLPDGLAEPIGRAFAGSAHPSHIDPAILAAILAACDHGAVLDPFMGIGGTVVAAVQSGRFAIGVDVKEECCAMAKKRLEALA